MAVTALFPSLSGVAFPVKRTPEWSTKIHRAVSGKKTTLGLYSYPVYRYELSYGQGDGGFLRSSSLYLEYQELFAFYNSVGGARDLFRYSDTDDNTASSQRFGTGDSTTREFQLIRTTTGTVSSWSDPIWASTISKVTVAGSSVSSTTFTIGDTGLITFSSAAIPAAGSTIAWSGTYWWLSRFNEDSATFEKFMKNLISLGMISFRTEKF